MTRFALFGAGFIGNVHAGNIARHPGAELAYVHDVNAEASKRLVERYGGAQVEDPESIWEDSSVDVVLIASSTDSHAPLLLRAAQSGKGVLCEKPIDLELGKVKDVASEVARSGIRVGMGLSRRFDANHRAVHDAVQRGDVGSVELMQLTSRGPKPPPISYVKVSGGQLRDQTIHFFDLARWIAGEDVVEVYTKGACLIDPAIGAAGDVDTSVVMMTMANGAICTIDSSRRASYGYDERIEVFGSDGLVISERQPTSEFVRYSGNKAVHDGLHAGWFERLEASFYSELDAFLEALAGGTEPSPSIQDGLKAQLVAEAAVRSLASERPEAVEVWEPDRGTP